MALLGQRNTLTIVREAPPGLYLDGGSHGEILLPGRYIPPGAKAGQKLDVFIYRDSEDRLVATTETPLATVGQFASLRVAFVLRKGEIKLVLQLREIVGAHGTALTARHHVTQRSI